MKKIKAFIFKERRLASLIWLWGLLGTVILFVLSVLLDYLETFTPLSRIPYFSGALVLLIPIYYFFTLYLSSRAYTSKPFLKSLQFIGQIAVLILFVGFWFVYALNTTNYQENKPFLFLEEDAPSIFTEKTKLAYPSDAELIHTSLRKWRANQSKNIVFRVNDLDSFRRTALEKYEFTSSVMNFPNFGGRRFGERNGNVLLPPFCMGTKFVDVKPRYFTITREVTEPENFCGERDALFTQIRRESEIGIIMVILPQEKLVWLNSTSWF